MIINFKIICNKQTNNSFNIKIKFKFKLLKFQMGNNQSNLRFQQKLTFFHTFDDPYFGKCKIYKQNQNNIQYYMQFHRYLDQRVINVITKKLDFLKKMYDNQSTQLFLKIYSYEIKQNSFLNGSLLGSCNIPQLTVYIQFLRHNLKDFIQWRKKEQKSLTYEQIIMALNKAIKGFEKTQSLKKIDPQFQQPIQFRLNLQNISVTVEGQLRFNPLIDNTLQKLFIQRNNSFKSHNSSPLKQKIIQRKQYFSENNLRNNKYNLKKSNKNGSIYEQISFLSQLKKFANQLVWDVRHQRDYIRNPQQGWVSQKKQIKRLLSEMHKATNLNQIKKIIGLNSINCFYTQFQKLKHEQSEAKFHKMASQLYQKSQSTDSSYHQDSLFNVRQFEKTKLKYYPM